MVVFWNVGQGQWITAVTPDQCLHYDFGGEMSYWAKNKNLFLKLCKNKENVLFLSHPDLDHYAYYSMLVNNLAKICWSEIDHTRLPLKRVSRKIPACESQLPKGSQRLFVPASSKNTNANSKIYRFDSILIPGDSPQKQEKIWIKNLKAKDFKILALGHHGSKTSTSEDLLKKMGHLKLALVQSRKKRFNHPHPETLDKLNKYYVPLIKVEEWGSTAIIL